MNQFGCPGGEHGVLAALRRVLQDAKFREGLIVATRHDSRFTKLQLSVTVHRKCEPAAGGPAPSPLEQTAWDILERLDEVFRSWAFGYGEFRFDVLNTDVALTTIQLGIRPDEEYLLVPLCGGQLITCTARPRPLPPKG